MSSAPVNPKLSAAALQVAQQKKAIWHDGPIACHYADAAFEVVLGMVNKTACGWDAFDLQSTNSSETGPYSVGHFVEEKGKRSAQDRAKQAVEEYWATLGCLRARVES